MNYLPESRHNLKALRSVLEALFQLVGQPVIKDLRKLEIPEQFKYGSVQHLFLFSSPPRDEPNSVG